MLNTVKKSAKKLTSSRTRSNLTYRENFWDFYVTNKQELDYYLDVAVTKYSSSTMSRDDLKQDILLKLNEKDILKSFNPKKSNLNTYITNHFRWEASHFAKQWKTYDQREISMADIEENCVLLESSHTDDSAVAADLIQKMREYLPEHHQNVFNFIVKEYSQTEIAQLFGITNSYVSIQTGFIKDKISKFLKRMKNAEKRSHIC